LYWSGARSSWKFHAADRCANALASSIAGPFQTVSDNGGSRVFFHENYLSSRSKSMNWDQIEGNWKQMSGKVKEKWGQLTDSDLSKINGREQLEGLIQKQYGYSKEQAKKEVDDWLNRTQ
jgi:uncharacterized protein YjbJ (UPF0337 family)